MSDLIFCLGDSNLYLRDSNPLRIKFWFPSFGFESNLRGFESVKFFLASDCKRHWVIRIHLEKDSNPFLCFQFCFQSSLRDSNPLMRDSNQFLQFSPIDSNPLMRDSNLFLQSSPIDSNPLIGDSNLFLEFQFCLQTILRDSNPLIGDSNPFLHFQFCLPFLHWFESMD